MDKKINVGGRRPKEDPATHRYGIKLNTEENDRFDQLFEESGLGHRARFIKARVFGTPMRVVRIDKVATDYYIRLSELYRQFRAVGVNYNQTVRSVKTNFGELRARALLGRLERTTFELIAVGRQVVELTQRYEEERLRKSE